MLHSTIVGGSTAKRVMKCPASVNLCAKMPPKHSSVYADRGTLLHNVMAEVLDKNLAPESLLGMKYNDIVFTQDLLDEKITPALAALDEIDPARQMDFAVESKVAFGALIPGAFGSTDLLGRLDDRVIMLDWKFGDGVPVDAEENPQLMYYVAAAMRTQGLDWVFEDAREVECIIVQPPAIKRWVTSFDRIRQFERELVYAVKLAQSDSPPMHTGDHCRWCAAKAICPLMTGAVDRALQSQVRALDTAQLSAALDKADILEQWISDLRGLACQVLDAGGSVPGYKLVAKRATRKWVDEDAAKAALLSHLPESELMEASMISPAQAEKKLKKLKLALPDNIVAAVSTGNTLVPVSDPRPEVLQIGRQLMAALSKIA
jgi:hypothetical protein